LGRYAEGGGGSGDCCLVAAARAGSPCGGGFWGRGGRAIWGGRRRAQRRFRTTHPGFRRLPFLSPSNLVPCGMRAVPRRHNWFRVVTVGRVRDGMEGRRGHVLLDTSCAVGRGEVGECGCVGLVGFWGHGHGVSIQEGRGTEQPARRQRGCFGKVWRGGGRR